MKRKTYKETVTAKIKRGEIFSALIISLFFLLFFLWFQTNTVYGGDGGDMVSAAYVRGVAHPPGYPLYTFLGWLLTKIPHNSVAWRVSLLSSISGALCMGVYYLITTFFFEKKITRFITVATLGFSYLFWLYASIPEVFALHLLLVTILLFLTLFLYRSPDKRVLYTFGFFLGLSLTHHHTIALIVVPLLLMIWKTMYEKRLSITVGDILKTSLFFGIGLIPYVYVWFAAQSYPFVNWENPQTVSGFLRLITRAIYGTFRSGTSFGLNFSDRIYQVRLLTQTVSIDFTRLSLPLAIVGIVYSYRKHRLFSLLLLSAFFITGPFFAFYAGFPTFLNFYLGITERFYLMSYVFFVLLMGYGIEGSYIFIDGLISRLINRGHMLLSCRYLFIIIPITIALGSYPKIISLKNDLTAEHLGEDILATVEPNSLILLLDDTSFFNTEYVYVTMPPQKRQGKKLLQLGTFDMAFYTDTLKHVYPDLDTTKMEKHTVLESIVARYADSTPIYSNIKVDVGKEYGWIQMGLLKKLYKTQTKIGYDDYIAQNEALFSTYHDPLSGALATYTHVTLADVARVYSYAHREVADVYASIEKYDSAQKHYETALAQIPDNVDLRLALTKTLIAQKKCDQAKGVMDEQVELYSNNADNYLLLAHLYTNCFSDKAQSDRYTKLYTELQKNKQGKLSDF